jgi:hypothetical protein
VAVVSDLQLDRDGLDGFGEMLANPRFMTSYLRSSKEPRLRRNGETVRTEGFRLDSLSK